MEESNLYNNTNGWYDKCDPTTGTMTRVQQQMHAVSCMGQMEHAPLYCKRSTCNLQGKRVASITDKMKWDDLRALLASQPDFCSVRPELQELVESRWHIYFYLVQDACHPECMQLSCAGQLGACETLLQATVWQEYNSIKI